MVSVHDRAYMRSITMRPALAILFVLLPVSAAQAQQHRVSIASEPDSLEVFIDSARVCRTPCEQMLDPGRYRLTFARPHDEASRRSEHGRHPHLDDYEQHEYGMIDVDRAINLRVRWLDHSGVRLAGDVVLIVGLTLGALLAGTLFASYTGDDDSLLIAGSVGVALGGLSLAIGIPMSLYDDAVHAAP